MKIAIIASNTGEKALYIHDFFKEGNRIAVDCLLTDNPESPVAQRMRDEGIDVIFMSPSEQMAELASLLKTRDIELLVVDDFEGDVPAELKEAFGEAMVYPSAKEKAPLEVIETTDRLKAAMNAAMQQPHREEDAGKDKEENGEDAPATLEQEWAEVLDMKLEGEEPSEARNPEESQQPTDGNEPPLYQDGPRVNDNRFDPQQSYGQQQAYGPQPSYGQPPYGQQPYGGQPYQQQPYRDPRFNEPMPDNYLLWSVLLTVFCCLIPGIIAIIYSASVGNKYYAGDIEGARRASRNAQIWCIVSVIAGILWATLYIPLTLFLS